MSHIKYFTTIIFILIFNSILGQERITLDRLYSENEIVYKLSDDKQFTGIVEHRRKNGHLVYEGIYDKGIIISSNLYYNGKKKILSNRTIYSTKVPYLVIKEFGYSYDSDLYKIITYDENGKKLLVEEFEDGKLTYKCEYSGKKKHGKEFCYSNEGKELTFIYVNGKKQK